MNTITVEYVTSNPWPDVVLSIAVIVCITIIIGIFAWANKT